jgi:hypothetical protein
MNKYENIQEAIEMIEEAKALIEDTIRGTSDWDHFKAYGAYGLDQALGGGNRYDSSLYELLEKQ